MVLVAVLNRQNRLIKLGKLFGLKDFVETGTQAGHTFRIVQRRFERAFTIDHDGHSPKFRLDFEGSPRVFLFKGSSGDMLPGILEKYGITRALFWLDAHGNETFFKDDGNNQIPKEMDAIDKCAPESLVVIDDISHYQGRYWVNSSYELKVPEGWQAGYYVPARIAILHKGGYVLLEGL